MTGFLRRPQYVAMRLNVVMSDDHLLLERATAIVADRYIGPYCVEASALLVEVGARLGYELEARPVSMFATNLTPIGSEATGDQGRAWGESYLSRRGAGVEVGGEFTGGTPFERHAGHMIVVSIEHDLVMDPTFTQFRKLGPQARPLFANQAPLRLERFWQLSDGDFFVRYFRADDFPSLDYVSARNAVGEEADEIASILLKAPTS